MANGDNPNNINDIRETNTSQIETKQPKTNKELMQNLKKEKELSELTPEDFWTSWYRKFEFKNINPTDKSLEFNWKIYKYWDWSYVEWKGPNWLLYCDYWKENNDSFMVWEFIDWKIQKWFAHYSFTQAKQYETWEFEGEWLLKNWKRVRRNWKIEEWEFDNWELNGWKITHPNGTIEIVFSK